MNLAAELRALIGEAAVADDPATLAAHAGDKWFAAHAPESVVFAQTAEDVSRTLRFANERRIPSPRAGRVTVMSAAACRRWAASRFRSRG